MSELGHSLVDDHVHSYPYYSPYYYSDWYYSTPGSDAVGVVFFLIFFFGIFICIFWSWSDDDGNCGTSTTVKHKVVHHVDARVQRPLLQEMKRSVPLAPVEQPKVVSKEASRPYKPLRPYAPPKPVAINVGPQRGWTQKQIQLVSKITVASFFVMLEREILAKIKQKKNPRIVASALINLRKKVVPDEADVILLQKYIAMDIYNVKKADILMISEANQLKAINIVTLLTGFIGGYKDLPDNIMLWVTDFVL
jgi:hypothetical protein